MNDSRSENPEIKKLKNEIDMVKLLEMGVENGIFDDFPSFDKQKTSENFEKIHKLKAELGEFEVFDEFNNFYQKNGWIAYESMNLEMMNEAVKIAKEKNVEKGENYLVNYYSNHLKDNLFMLEYPEEISIRKHLIDLAYKDYSEERYYSCILLLLSIIDGFVADTKIAGNNGFFSDNDDLYSWNSIAAHKSGLNELSKLLYKNRGKTNLEEITIPYRNGIIHGRDLNYNNKTNATKLWATLFALKDGIIKIKNNGQHPPEEEKHSSLIEIVNQHEENIKNFAEIDKWQNRSMVVNEDFPEFGLSSDYKDESPEKELVKFFEYWMDGNFGDIAKLSFDYRKESSLNNEAGKLAREVFNNKKLKSFKILEINDESIIVTNIKTELKITIDSKEIIEKIEFRLIYKNENNKPLALRTLKNGHWTIATFRDIQEIKNDKN